MKTKRSYLSGIGSGIILFHAAIFLTAFILTGCYTDKKISSASIDMIVVFNKDIPVAKASSIMFESEYIFSDVTNSKMIKTPLQETGPGYIVKVPKDKIDDFNTKMKSIPHVYEVYRADYYASKD
jgi:hypothetical protein